MSTTVTDFDLLSGEIVTREIEMADKIGLGVGDDVRATARITATFNRTIRNIKPGTVGRVVALDGPHFVVRFLIGKGKVLDVRVASEQVAVVSSPAQRRIV